MIEAIPPHLLRAGLGLIAGVALGYLARQGRFCTLGAIEDAVYANDQRRLRAWMLAAAVAILGAHALEAAGGMPLSASVYAGPRLEWGGAVLGGLMFGFGMALLGTCAFGALLRLGGGDLRALIAFLVIGISGIMVMRGLTGLGRVVVIDRMAIDLPASQRLGHLLGLGPAAGLTFALFVGAGVAALALSSEALRRSPKLVAAGIAVGALVVTGWAITGIVGRDPFDMGRVESFTFVRPLGETILYAMLASGVGLDFPVGTALGVVVGAALQARAAGQFRWEAPDDARELKRHLAGAFLMGTGGAAALGCTIGQGVTGVSTLSLGSLLALGSILLGARLGLYFLVERSLARHATA